MKTCHHQFISTVGFTLKAFPVRVLCLAFCSFVALGDATRTAGAPTTTAPPNIVLFLADDLGWADVPWHGSPFAMPHLTKLAEEGVRLEAHYVHPMCSPTRAALLSGRYASRFGVTAAQNARVFPFNTPTLASLLKSAGYTTALVGKWHLGSKPGWGPQRFGFDHSYGSLAGGCGPYDHRYKAGEFSKTWHRNGTLVDEEGHVTDLIAREAVEWLERRGDQPFFLYVPFTAIHVPIAEPDKWQQANARLVDPGQRLRAACASHMDDAIGMVLAALERNQLRSRTLVLFLSDNGAHRLLPNQGGPYPGDYGPLKVGNDNLPFRGHKSSVDEGGVRTPGIANWPGRLTPGELKTPLHAVDWLPTLAALAGVHVCDDLKLDGGDVWPLLVQPDKTVPPRTIYSAGVGFRSATLRYGDWKLVILRSSDPGTATEMLFDLANDPGETRNLAAAKPGLLVEMKERLENVCVRDKDAVARD